LKLKVKLNLNLFVRNNLIFFIMADPKDQNQISIELNEEVAQGIYSNLAVITHSASEFVIDFVRIMPGIPKAQVKSRVILTPEHAKRLVAALQDNIDKYESVHGHIKGRDQSCL
jgi:site-specific recombinase